MFKNPPALAVGSTSIWEKKESGGRIPREKIMKNITKEAQEVTPHKEMPSIGEFVSAKMTDAFSSLGESFGKSKDKLALNRDLFTAKAGLETKAKNIGRYVIDEIAKGNTHILIPQKFIEEVYESRNEISEIQEKLKSL